MHERIGLRLIIGLASVAGLLAIFVLQRYDFSHHIDFWISPTSLSKFIINRSVRFLVNDVCTIGLIYALFPYRKYVMFAISVQIAGVFLLLLPYFILKVYYPSYNGPMINFLHRLILNPVLLLLLIPAFYYQNKIERRIRDMEERKD
jgi:exosortase F-associated protein